MIQRFLSKFNVSADEPFQSPIPSLPLQVECLHFVVGDLHGCAHLLDQCIDKIRAIYDAKPEGTEARVVFVGDYVDRGEDSATVLKVLRDLSSDGQTICLMGNHEKMMLDFMADPARNGRRWMRYGGLQTLASFGVRGVHERMESDELRGVAADLKGALPDGLMDWVADLPLTYQNGNLTCVHAAVNPDVALSEQTKSDLLWGNPNFFKRPHISGRTIAFGHTIQDTASYQDQRIALDTGAYASGRLSMAVIDGDHVSLVEV